ncbi:hypothetical protein PENSPDRAFT_224294 [Peniophora sp. CONT]|nr:hypothetical protein PENSPDRAFT_224294 [Peniophora sp. CONT]
MPAVTRLAGWKYKEGVTDEQKRFAKDAMLKLYEDLAHLVNHGPVGGKNNSQMGVHKGLDLAFTVEFKSEEARDEFNPHPIHAESVQKVLTPLIEDLFVYDFVKGDYGV